MNTAVFTVNTLDFCVFGVIKIMIEHDNPPGPTMYQCTPQSVGTHCPMPNAIADAENRQHRRTSRRSSIDLPRELRRCAKSALAMTKPRLT